jgi:hypothetical protein
MNLLPWFESLNNSAAGVAIRESVWFAAVIQAFHLVALGVFAGAVLIVDLRLLGRGLSTRPSAQLARDAQPWLIAGLLALLVTGVPQLVGNAVREYYSIFFWIKMVVLILAVIFTFTVRRKVAMADEGQVAPAWAKTVGVISMAMWLVVAVTARLIGLFT